MYTISNSTVTHSSTNGKTELNNQNTTKDNLIPCLNKTQFQSNDGGANKLLANEQTD